MDWITGMKTTILETKGLFEELDHLGIEKRLIALTGVKRVEANPASSSVTVEFDPEVTSEAALREEVQNCGFHCRGQMLPSHVSPFSEPDLDTAHPRHASQPGAKDEMAHEMGHGAGMDMAVMVRDMRNRFVVCFSFSAVLFIWAPQWDSPFRCRLRKGE